MLSNKYLFHILKQLRNVDFYCSFCMSNNDSNKVPLSKFKLGPISIPDCRRLIHKVFARVATIDAVFPLKRRAIVCMSPMKNGTFIGIAPLSN
jgi:hypothetical protein